MKLSYEEFELLTLLEREKKMLTQKEISKLTKIPLETLINIQKKFQLEKIITKNNKIMKKGLKLLEPYKVKRAIFLAAGYGSRLLPITINTPKPLIRVNGKMIIETLLDACKEAEIEEIIIVTGYLSEQFDLLLKKYPNIKFINNNLYNKTNNISSAYLIKDYISNAYVLESDLYLYNKKIIRKYEYRSNFLGKKVEKTNDWCFEENAGIITKQKIGGQNCYQMYGISYYTSDYTKQISEDIENVFISKEGKNKYWEQVILDINLNHYKIYIRECYDNDIIEIDTFNELKEVDKSYDV